MAVTAADIAFVTDLFSELNNLSTRKMFGGLSIYADGQIFALIGPDDKLFLKAKDDLATELADQGGEQFVYHHEKSGKVSRMHYWTLPEDALDDPEIACDWARKSLRFFGETLDLG